MARNDVVNKDGSINWDEIGSHTDKINVLSGNIGDKTLLNTTAKDSLVNATNELHYQFGILSHFANLPKNDTTQDSGALLNTLINTIVSGRIVISDSTLYVGTQIQVKPGIILDFYNTTVKPKAPNVDLLFLYPGGKINNLVVDTTGANYTNKVLTLDPVIAGANYFTQNPTEYSIKGIGDNGLGTLVYYHQNNTTPSSYSWITFVKAKIQAYGFNKQIDVFSEAQNTGGTGGWINGNVFDVILEGGTYAIHIHGTGDLLANDFKGQIQSKVGWTQRGFFVENGEYNKFEGSIWDTENFSISAMEWGSGAYWGNTITSYVGIPTVGVVNNSSYYDNTVITVGGGVGEMKAYNSVSKKYVSVGMDNTGKGFLTFNGATIANLNSGGINMNGNSIWGFALDNGTTAQRPSSPSQKQVFFDNTLGKVIFYSGTSWKDANNVQPNNIGINVAVAQSVTTLTVTFPTTETDASYAVQVSPAWNTTYWITGKSTTGFTINFGTAPASASTLDWTIKR